MIDSYGHFSAYHVALADGLSYWQLGIHGHSTLLLMNRGNLWEGACV